MNQTIDLGSSGPPHATIAIDADGRLYQPRVRADLRSQRGPDGAGSAAGRSAAIEAVSALRLAAKLMHLAMERWADLHGLSEGRLQLLFSLRLHPQGVALGNLARLLHVSPRNVTGLVDILERDGLVERVPASDDRRSVVARLTKAGQQRINSIWREALAQQEPLTKDLSEEELSALRHLCLRLVQNLDEIVGLNGWA